MKIFSMDELNAYSRYINILGAIGALLSIVYFGFGLDSARAFHYTERR